MHVVKVEGQHVWPLFCSQKNKNLRFCTVAKSDPPDLKYFDHAEKQRDLGPVCLMLVRDCSNKVCVMFESSFANDWNVGMGGKL